MRFFFNVGNNYIDSNELDEGTWKELTPKELKDVASDSDPGNCYPLVLVAVKDDCLYFDFWTYSS